MEQSGRRSGGAGGRVTGRHDDHGSAERDDARGPRPGRDPAAAIAAVAAVLVLVLVGVVVVAAAVASAAVSVSVRVKELERREDRHTAAERVPTQDQPPASALRAVVARLSCATGRRCLLRLGLLSPPVHHAGACTGASQALARPGRKGGEGSGYAAEAARRVLRVERSPGAPVHAEAKAGEEQRQGGRVRRRVQECA